MNDCTIGILAGMGPRSTAPFIDLVVSECQLQYEAKYDEEFPKMMIYSLPTPFFIDRPINHDLMKKTITKGLQELESTGVNFIAVPCNTAHIYYNELKASVQVPLLNIVEETLKNLPVVSQRVTLFSTSSTFESDIYQKGIQKAGHKFIFKQEWQSAINNLIQCIKTNKNDDQNKRLWENLINQVNQEFVDYIIIACTDLNVVANLLTVPVHFIDSSKCLASTVVKKYLELAKKN